MPTRKLIGKLDPPSSTMPKNYPRKTDSLPTCMNCSAVLYGAFCAQCGQKAAKAMTFRHVLEHTQERLRHLDFAWLRTAAGLSTDPGRLVRNYLRGRRRPYVAPLPYALGTSTLLFLTVLLAQDPNRLARLTPWSMTTGPTHLALTAIGIYGALLITLGVAVLQRSLHRDAGHGLLETWIFGLYVFGHLALYQILFALLGAFESTLGLAALGLAIVLILAFALAGFYRQAVLRAVPTALILSTTYIAGVFVLSALTRLALT